MISGLLPPTHYVFSSCRNTRKSDKHLKIIFKLVDALFYLLITKIQNFSLQKYLSKCYLRIMKTLRKNFLFEESILFFLICDIYQNAKSTPPPILPRSFRRTLYEDGRISLSAIPSWSHVSVIAIMSGFISATWLWSSSLLLTILLALKEDMLRVFFPNGGPGFLWMSLETRRRRMHK